MTRINLRFYAKGFVEVFCRLKTRHESAYRLTAVVDTGAQISLLPLEILDLLEDAGSPQTRISLEQAGITRHSFEAVEARIALQFEDLEGNVSEVITAPCWFADTEVALIGFEGVLDRAVLHIDYPGRIGWIDV